MLKIKIILPFIDQCAAHSKNTFLRTIKATFFPGNCTSQLQPFDVGIIHAFKCDIKVIHLKDYCRDRWQTIPRFITYEAI
jgi:hypothetical protein